MKSNIHKKGNLAFLLVMMVIGITMVSFVGGTVYASDRMTLQLWTTNKNLANNPDAFYIKKIENKFNVDLEIKFRNAGGDDYVQWLNLKLMSGDAPDWFRDQQISVSMLNEFVDQGLVAEIDPKMVEENMPGYMKWTKKYSSIFGDNPLSIYAVDGRIYSIPDAKVDLPKFTLMAYRSDWMKNVGVTKTPETLDEVEDLLKKFTFDDPDGDGIDDTYGYIGITSDPTWAFSPFFGAFGTYPGIFYVKNDGTVTRGEIEPETKEALKYIHKLYKEGVIDPEWVTAGFEQSRNKVISSKVGAVWQNWLSILTPDGWYSPLKDVEPQAGWNVSTGPVGPNGDRGLMQFSPLAGVGIVFSKHMEDQPEKMAKYMQVFDAISRDPDWFEAEIWGVKGVTFYLDNEGNHRYTDKYSTEDARFQYGFGPDYRFPSLETFMYDPDIHDKYLYDKKLLKTRQKTLKMIQGKYDVLAPYPKPVYEEKEQDLPDVEKIFTEFIVGDRPISEFDDFVDNWMNSGGKEILEEAQQVYNKYYGGK